MKIAFLGDIALFGKNNAGDKSYIQRFARIKQLLDGCDYVVGNLESPLTEHGKPIGGKSAYLKGAPADVEILKHLGVTHVSLANNHVFDYGSKGLADTIEVLDKNGIAWYGVNDVSADITSGDASVTLRGYCCYSTNAKGMGTEDPHVNILDPASIELELESDKNAGRFTVLSIHWGLEHVHLPSADHIKTAAKLVNGRNALIHGHHPHVIQGVEQRGSALVAYSLGNFCFDDVYTDKSAEPLIKLSQDNMESFVLIAEINGCELTDYRIVPFSFASGEYELDDAISKKIEGWSEELKLPLEEITARRNADFSKYVGGRKKQRDLNWYLKRLNFESVKMILASKSNARAYSKYIKEFADKA